MKVVLYLACYEELRQEWNQFAPLGLGYLAAYARERMPESEFVIASDYDELISEKPDIVGITYVTHTASFAARQARKIKDALGCPVIVGGPHISTLPTILDPPYDVAILGEGEEAFTDLLQLYQAEKKFDPRSLAKIPGLLYRDESGAAVRSAVRDPIADMDSIPYPARDLMFHKWPRKPVEATIMTSRGCPYDCAFCSTVKHWGRGYRHPTNEYVLREVEQIADRYDPKMIHFYDDLFIVKRQRSLDLMKGLRERGLHEGRINTCFVRSNLITEELMEAFAETNFKILHIGFESGSDSVLATFNKQAANLDKNREVVRLARKYGIQMTSCFILGAPGETRRDLIETFDFVSSSMDIFWTAHFSPLVILPGTDVWKWAEAHGVSDVNLEGVVMEPEDFADGMAYYRNKWTYLNEKCMPREEFLDFLEVAARIERMVSHNAEMRRNCNKAIEEARTPQFVAENVSIREIVQEKAKRRLRKIMPTGHNVPTDSMAMPSTASN